MELPGGATGGPATVVLVELPLLWKVDPHSEIVHQLKMEYHPSQLSCALITPLRYIDINMGYDELLHTTRRRLEKSRMSRGTVVRVSAAGDARKFYV